MDPTSFCSVAQLLVAQQPVYRYRIDNADIIVDVDRWWLAFARENNALELNESSVVGHCLWDFIFDEPTQSVYGEIHNHVRSTGNPVTVPFRCDSPTLQRHMQLTINSEPDGKLLYESMLVRVVPQRRLAALDRGEKRSEAFLTMCSFCKRSLIEPSGWLELENIAIKLRMYERQTVPELRYTVCPECAKTVRREETGAARV